MKKDIVTKIIVYKDGGWICCTEDEAGWYRKRKEWLVTIDVQRIVKASNIVNEAAKKEQD